MKHQSFAGISWGLICLYFNPSPLSKMVSNKVSNKVSHRGIILALLPMNGAYNIG